MNEDTNLVEEEEVPAPTNIENDLITLGGQSSNLNNINDSVAEASNDHDDLLKIASIMEESDEPITPMAAEMAQVAIESIYKRLGVTNYKKTPSIESFKDKSTSKSSTKIAIEGAKEVIVAAWKAIVEAVKKAAKWIKEFFSKLFGSVEGFNEKIKAKIERYKEFQSNAKYIQKDIKISNANVKRKPKNIVKQDNVAKEDMEQSVETEISQYTAGYLFGDSTDTPSLFRNVQNLKVMIKTELPKLFTVIHSYMESGENIYGNFKDRTSLKDVKFASIPTILSLKATNEVSGNLVKFIGSQLPGNKTLTVFANKNQASLVGVDAISGVMGNKIGINQFTKVTGSNYDKRIPVLSQENAIKLLEAAIDINTSIIGAESMYKKLEVEFEKYVSSLNKFESYISANEFDSSDKIVLAKLKSLAQTFMHIGTQSISELLTFSLRCTKSMVDYAELSLSCYE